MKTTKEKMSSAQDEYEERSKAKGYTRMNVRVHKNDRSYLLEVVKKERAKLEEKRLLEEMMGA